MMTEVTTYWRQRRTRRNVLRGTALAGTGLVGAALLGCGKEEKPAPVPVSATPRRGGILVHAGGSQGAHDTTRGSLDPHTEARVLGVVFRLVHQALLGYNPRTYEAEPDLAQSWEQPSPVEYIFKLHSGVKWHNKPPAHGRELTATDVVFSLDRARTPNPRFLHRSILASVDKVEALNRSMVRIATKQPDVTTVSALSSDGILIMNPETLEKVERPRTADDVIGSGAFILKDLQERVAGEYVRNPDYFQPGLPYLDGVRTPFFADPETAYAAFQAGRLHIAIVPGTQVKSYLAGREATEADWYDIDFIHSLVPQVEKEPFKDRRVTRALRLLADHDAFIQTHAEVLYGRGYLGSVFPSALKAWDVPQEEYRRSIFWQQPKERAIREALDLLRAAGFTRDTPLRFELTANDTPFIKPGAELLHAQFRQNSQGVVQTSDLRLYDSARATQVQVQGAFDYGYWPFSVALVEPGVFLSSFYRTGGSSNYGRLSDPRLDELIDKQNTTFDVQQRKALIQEIVRYMMENSPVIAAARYASINAVHPKVRNFAPEWWLYGWQYQRIWLEA